MDFFGREEPDKTLSLITIKNTSFMHLKWEYRKS